MAPARELLSRDLIASSRSGLSSGKAPPGRIWFRDSWGLRSSPVGSNPEEASNRCVIPPEIVVQIVCQSIHNPPNIVEILRAKKWASSHVSVLTATDGNGDQPLTRPKKWLDKGRPSQGSRRRSTRRWLALPQRRLRTIVHLT
jgi:hypothetical protein